jgi:mannose-1-phosphate guanylyltransferase
MVLIERTDNSADRNHWGLVLAAGDGTRLEAYVQRLLGYQLPKQYVNFVGRRSMLEHTFGRAERLISRPNIITIVSKTHLQHIAVRRQLASRVPGTVIVQPANKETGPGILLPLMHIYKRSPEAIVSVFPSDHFILEEERFLDHVELAARAVAHNPDRIVLLAVEAHSAEQDYGYVVPGAHAGEIDLHGTRRVARFVEKPNARAARELVDAGAFWNTMVMVLKIKTLLQMIESIAPDTHRQFSRIFAAVATSHERSTVEAVYHKLQPMNFSRDILENIARACGDAISVLPVLQVYWSDWGSPIRLLASQRLLRLGGGQQDSLPHSRHLDTPEIPISDMSFPAHARMSEAKPERHPRG